MGFCMEKLRADPANVLCGKVHNGNRLDPHTLLKLRTKEWEFLLEILERRPIAFVDREWPCSILSSCLCSINLYRWILGTAERILKPRYAAIVVPLKRAGKEIAVNLNLELLIMAKINYNFNLCSLKMKGGSKDSAERNLPRVHDHLLGSRSSQNKSMF